MIAHPEPPLTAMLAVLPCSTLTVSRAFYGRLGFAAVRDHGDYLILQGHGTELHLQRAVAGWLIPGRNPFGLYLRVKSVDEVAEAFGQPVLHAPRVQPWGMYEFALSDPDDTLVRIGWPIDESTRRRA